MEEIILEITNKAEKPEHDTPADARARERLREEINEIVSRGNTVYIPPDIAG